MNKPKLGCVFNLKEINRELFEYAQTNEEYKGMGTTCVCALVFDKQLVVANIGDSRAYLINSRKLNKLLTIIRL